MAMQDWSIQDLFDRGMIEDVTVLEEFLADIGSGKTLTIYQGFDPTSPHLHIGHLLSLRVLRWFQLHGHRVIFLIGDFTGRIGDPSERPEKRKRLTHQQVLDNAATYREQISKILNLEGENPVAVKFNGSWLDPLTLRDFIDIADKFTIQQLLQRSMFQDRIGNSEPLFLNEVLYPIMQGYDSVAMEVDAELGGRDQLFNMRVGRDLVRAYLNKTKHVITTPLLPGLDGRKMSKSYGNTVDLTENPIPMFFKLSVVQDSLLPIFLKTLTDIPQDEISAVETRLDSDHNLKDAREHFAHTIVTNIHGIQAADAALEEFQHVIDDAAIPSDIPSVQLPPGVISAYGIKLVDLLSSTPHVSSKSDARRLIEQGAIRLNGEKMSDPNSMLLLSQISEAILKVGRRGYARIHVPM